jgi:hypothetical protein
MRAPRLHEQGFIGCESARAKPSRCRHQTPVHARFRNRLDAVVKSALDAVVILRVKDKFLLQRNPTGRKVGDLHRYAAQVFGQEGVLIADGRASDAAADCTIRRALADELLFGLDPKAVG